MIAKTTRALSLLERLRTNRRQNTTTAARTNTKAPIAEPDQATIRAYLAEHQPEWLGVWYDLSLETGWRTNDCARLRYEAIDWDTREVTIVVSKQTRAAEARAASKGIKELRTVRQSAALAAGDAAAYMKWANATREELEADATPAEIDRLQCLVDGAKVKIDTKELSAELLARLAAMKDAAFWDDGYVFSRALTASNSTRMESGEPIRRQTIWQRMKAVFTALADVIANAAKLSSYSTRKSFAVALYHATGKSIADVMKAMGHASEQMSLKYMGLDDSAAEGQRRMVRGVAA